MTQPNWDMSQERQFIENLLCQRFNFFLVIYAAVIGGALAAGEQAHLCSILCLGTVLTAALAFTIFRADAKLSIILDDHLYKLDGHEAKIINDEIKQKPWYRRFCSARKILGWVIPIFCVLTLLAGFILSLPCIEIVKVKTDVIKVKLSCADDDESQLCVRMDWAIHRIV